MINHDKPLDFRVPHDIFGTTWTNLWILLRVWAGQGTSLPRSGRGLRAMCQSSFGGLKTLGAPQFLWRKWGKHGHEQHEHNHDDDDDDADADADELVDLGFTPPPPTFWTNPSVWFWEVNRQRIAIHLCWGCRWHCRALQVWTSAVFFNEWMVTWMWVKMEDLGDHRCECLV